MTLETNEKMHLVVEVGCQGSDHRQGSPPRQGAVCPATAFRTATLTLFHATKQDTYFELLLLYTSTKSL
jgi:hypothetical protein